MTMITTRYISCSSSNFATFEGVGVGTTNYGYAIIGEDFTYTGVATVLLLVLRLEVLITIQSSHSSGDNQVMNFPVSRN